MRAALLAESKSPAFYREWMDSFFARDIQRLFGFRDINRFTAFLEYVLRQSGGQFDVSKTASELGIARATVESHLRALETTHAATRVRPFHRGSSTELVKQPKVYGFDTGFVSFVRGWNPLRSEDLGDLWEHVVLETLQARLPETPPLYWRDKRGREIDFVIPATATPSMPSSANGIPTRSMPMRWLHSGPSTQGAETTSSALAPRTRMCALQKVSKSKSSIPQESLFEVPDSARDPQGFLIWKEISP